MLWRFQSAMYPASTFQDSAQFTQILDADQQAIGQLELAFTGKAPYDLRPCDGTDDFLVTDWKLADDLGEPESRVFSYSTPAEASYIEFAFNDGTVFFNRAFGRLQIDTDEGPKDAVAVPPILSIEYETN